MLSGRCYDRESVPFKAVDVLIEALVALLEGLALHDQVTRLVASGHPHAGPTVSRATCGFSRIEDRCNIKISNIDDRQIRYRAFFALRELLVSISQ